MPSGAELLRQIKEQVKEVDPRDVHDIVNNGYDAFVVDVREPYEWEAGHIDGSIHIPLAEVMAGGEQGRLSTDRPVVIVCRSGNRSELATLMLAPNMPFPSPWRRLAAEAAVLPMPRQRRGWLD